MDFDWYLELCTVQTYRKIDHLFLLKAIMDELALMLQCHILVY